MRWCSFIRSLLLVVTVLVSCGSDSDGGAADPSSTASTQTTETASAEVPTTTSTTPASSASPQTSASASTAPAHPIDPSEEIYITDPDWLAADENFMYVKTDTHKVHRLDPSTGATLGTADIGGGTCQGLGVAFGSVWACRGIEDGGDVVVRIDPETDEIVAQIDIMKARMQGRLAGGFGRVWVITASGQQLVGVDPATNELDPPIDLGVVGTDLAVGADGVWVISSRDSAVVRVDPTTGAVNGRVDGIVDSSAIDASGDIWVASEEQLVQIDPATLSIVRTIPGGTGRASAITVAGTDLWIRSAEQFLVHVDTVSGAEVERLDDEKASTGGDVLVRFGAIWATAYDNGLLVRRPLGDAS